MIALPENRPTYTEQVLNPLLQLPRTLRQDIQRFGDYLTPDWNDEISNTLRIWQKNCAKVMELRRINHEEVLNSFLNQLERILVIPVLDIPLDEESMIGSDGRTYGKMFLCVHRFRTPEPFNLRSPIAGHDIRPFMTRPHEPVRQIVQWIKRYRPNFGAGQIQDEYRQLPVDKQHFPVISAKIQKIKLDQFERKREAEIKRKEDDRALDNLNQMIDKVIVPQIAAIQQNVVEQQTRMLERLDRVDGNFRQEEQILRNQFQQVDAAIQVLDKELVCLNQELNVTKDKIDETKHDNIRLQVAIKETEKAIKEREKGWFKELLMMVAVIGACWCGTWAAQAIAKAAGSAITPAISSVPSGAKVTLTLRF